MLRSVLGELNLTVYPEVSMVIFLLAFSAICWGVWTLNRHLDVGSASRLPLDDSPLPTARDEQEATR